MTDDRGTTGVRMAGDPAIVEDGAPDLRTRRACQYGAAMLAKAGTLPADCGDFDAHFDGVATIVFVRADSDQAEAARFTIPARVLAFGPNRPPKRLPDLRDATEQRQTGRAP